MRMHLRLQTLMALTSETLKTAAQRILQLEKDESSDAYMVALRIMLEDRVGSVGYSAPQTHRQTLEFVKTLLRAKLEMRLEPEDADFVLALALLNERLQRWQPALEGVQRARELRPDDASLAPLEQRLRQIMQAIRQRAE